MSDNPEPVGNGAEAPFPTCFFLLQNDDIPPKFRCGRGCMMLCPNWFNNNTIIPKYEKHYECPIDATGKCIRWSDGTCEGWCTGKCKDVI
jgi:hypothetical protein